MRERYEDPPPSWQSTVGGPKRGVAGMSIGSSHRAYQSPVCGTSPRVHDPQAGQADNRLLDSALRCATALGWKAFPKRSASLASEPKPWMPDTSNPEIQRFRDETGQGAVRQ